MIVQIFESRGLGLYIDGQDAGYRGWSLSEDDGTGHIEISTAPSEGKPKPLKIGPHNITGLTFDVNHEDRWEGKDPTRLTLHTTEGDWTGPITECYSGYPDETDEDEQRKVKIHGTDQERVIEEITLYIEAELTKN